MSLDALLGYPEGYLSRLADALDPPRSRDGLEARDQAASTLASQQTPSSTLYGTKNTVRDAKNPGGFGKVKS